MFETIGLLIKWVPTLLFVLILFVSFWVGFLRGHRKSAIFLLHSVITGTILIILYFVLLDTNFGDKLLLDVVNMFMGENGLQISLNVSIDCVSFRDVILEFVLQLLSLDESINVILGENLPYLQLLINLAFHIVLALAFYIVYLVILFILSLIYSIFYSDRAYKRRINKKFMEGKVPATFRKKRLAGGLIGLSRGLLSGLIAISMLGSTLYSLTGGKGEDSTLVEHDFNDSTINGVYSIYRAVENYGDVGIIKLFNAVQNKDEVPVYLLLSDAVMHGNVVIESENGNETYDLVLRDELSAYTGVIKGAFNILVKYFDEDLNSLISGTLTFDEFMLDFTESLNNGKMQTEISLLINDLLDANYLYSLSVSLLDSILGNIDNFAMLDPNVSEIIKVMFKKGYYSQVIPSEQVLMESESSIILPYISSSYLINPEDLSSILINVLSLMNTEMSENILENIKLYIDNFRYLSIFTDQVKKERFNQVLGRVFLVIENTFLSDSLQVQERKASSRSDTYQEIVKEIDPEYYDYIFGKKQISWVDEIDSLINTYDDIMVLVNNLTSEDTTFDITKIFDKEMETYEDNVSAYERICESVQESRVIARILRTKAITNVFVDSIKSLLPSFELMDNIQFENEYDENGNLVKNGELYYLFKGLRMILDPNKTNIYPLLMGDEFDVTTIEELTKELNKTDETGLSLTEYFVEFDFMRSIISSLLIDKLGSQDLMYISYRALEKDENGQTINVIQKEELKPLLMNLGDLITELKPLLEGEEVHIDTLIEGDTINSLIDNKIVQGTIASHILNFTENENVIVIPQHLKSIDNWIDSENNKSELVKLFNAIQALDISLDFENIDLLDTLKRISSRNRLDDLFETEVLYYTVSKFITEGNFGDFSIIVPNEAVKVLVNDSIDRLIKKDKLILFINNISNLGIDGESSVNDLLTNLVKYRDEYTNDVILSTSLIKILVNNFSNNLSFPASLVENASDSKLKLYSSNNPWREELPDLLNALDEIFKVSENEVIDVKENLENKFHDFLDQYNQPSSLDYKKTKLEVCLDSLVVSKSITDVIDGILTKDYIIERAKDLAKEDELYPFDEINIVLDVMNSYNINFTNVSDFNINNVLVTSRLKYHLRTKENAYLLRGILTKQIENLFTGSNNGLHSHPKAYEDGLLKKNEINSLVLILEGFTFESFDSNMFDLSSFDKYIYNQKGECDSYILASSISYSLMNDETIVVPKSVVGNDANNIIDVLELHKFIKATSDMMNVSSLEHLDVEKMEINESAFESKIMNATITNHLNISQNSVRKDAYVLASRAESDTLHDDYSQRVIVLKQEEYSSLIRALDVLTSHKSNLNINLDINFLLGLDDYSLRVLLESSVLSISINELFINSSFVTIIDNFIPNLQKVNVEVYNLSTEAKMVDEVYTNESIISIISYLRNL